jgi:hypothetical protein
MIASRFSLHLVRGCFNRALPVSTTTAVSAATHRVSAAHAAHGVSAAASESTSCAATGESTSCAAGISTSSARVAYSTATIANAAAIADATSVAVAASISVAIAVAASPIAAIPGSGADKDTTQKPARTVIPVRGASIWSVAVISVGAYGRGAVAVIVAIPGINPDTDADLSLGDRERNDQRTQNQKIP